MNDDLNPKEVFSGFFWEAQFVKDLLANEGVESFLVDELIGTIAPFNSANGLGAVKVVVEYEHYEKAKEIVVNFENNRFLP